MVARNAAPHSIPAHRRRLTSSYVFLLATLHSLTVSNPTDEQMTISHLSRRLAPTRALALLTAASVACGEAGSRPPSEWQAAYDTLADTVIVRTLSGSIWVGTADLVPELSIGDREGADEQMFGQIESLAVAPDGAIYVLDGMVPALRKYAPDGRYLSTFGRAGGGPGEYRMPDAGLAVLPDGRVLLRDPGNNRISVYSPDGQYLDGWRTRGSGTARPLYKDYLGNVYTQVVLNLLDDADAWRFGLVRYGPDGIPGDTLPAPTWNYETPTLVATNAYGGGTLKSLPFAPRARWAFSPLGYMIGGLPTHYSVDLFQNPGRVLRIERVDWRPVPVLPAERHQHERIVTAMMRRTEPGWRWTGPRIPETKPPYTELLVGESGRIWVQLHQEAEQIELDVAAADETEPQLTWIEPIAFDVFDTDGRYLGMVRAPRGFSTRPTPVIRGDTVWAVVLDELDVPSVSRLVVKSPLHPRTPMK
jgi:hypothetical protein